MMVVITKVKLDSSDGNKGSVRQMNKFCTYPKHSLGFLACEQLHRYVGVGCLGNQGVSSGFQPATGPLHSHDWQTPQPSQIEPLYILGPHHTESSIDKRDNKVEGVGKTMSCKSNRITVEG